MLLLLLFLKPQRWVKFFSFSNNFHAPLISNGIPWQNDVTVSYIFVLSCVCVWGVWRCGCVFRQHLSISLKADAVSCYLVSTFQTFYLTSFISIYLSYLNDTEHLKLTKSQDLPSSSGCYIMWMQGRNKRVCPNLLFQ